MTFIETDHPRGQAGNAGQFREKTNRTPAGGLGADPDMLKLETDRLTLEHLDERTDEAANADVHAVGEMGYAREELARSSTDPRVLSVLAHHTATYAPGIVARSPFASPAALHYLATNTDRTHQPDTRRAAVENDNVEEATLRAVWAARGKSPEARLAAAGITSQMKTPSDIIQSAFEEWTEGAGQHPNLPPATLAEAAKDPERVLHVARNPRLTAEQLDGMLDVEFGDEPEEQDDAMYVAHRVALHPNTPHATVKKLTEHPDSNVRRAARDRIWADAIRAAE